MQAFATSVAANEQALVQASKRARHQLDIFESSLSLRISAQKAIDLANKLPVIDAEELSRMVKSEDSVFDRDLQHCQKSLKGMTQQLLGSLQTMGDSSKGNGKRARIEEDSKEDVDALWERVEKSQTQLSGKWEAVLNKWHARVNFGSEKSKAKLKVFNNNIWDQINDIMMDDKRVIEKSCVPLADSERMGAQKALQFLEREQDEEAATTDEDREELLDAYGIYEDKFYDLMGKKHDAGSRNKRKRYDLEVYDDRQFYSLLLRTFIQNNANSSNSMRSEDMAELRRFKKKKNLVERKASKGRKIRYTVHDKLQNFMFPIPYSTIVASTKSTTIDSDRLFASLFQ